MAHYYVNRNSQLNGDHEVHTQNCLWMPSANNAIHLGDHHSCVSAVSAARRYYSQVNGCIHCSNYCHTQ